MGCARWERPVRRKNAEPDANAQCKMHNAQCTMRSTRPARRGPRLLSPLFRRWRFHVEQHGFGVGDLDLVVRLDLLEDGGVLDLDLDILSTRAFEHDRLPRGVDP